MPTATKELIRKAAFELSQRNDHADQGALDNWLEAERDVMKGLRESEATYEPSPWDVEAASNAAPASAGSRIEKRRKPN